MRHTHRIGLVTSFCCPPQGTYVSELLHGAAWSNVGCDQNLDGAVNFEAVPASQYEVRATHPNGSDYFVEPFIIDVSAGSTDFTAFAYSSNAESVQSTSVLLVTRNPVTGESLTDVCYELVGYSNIGCDENQDGRVQFQDIPYSAAYTIRQTKTPA